MEKSEDIHHQFLRHFTHHEPAVRAFVRRLVPSRADADDILQEVSVVLWNKFSEFRPEGDFRAWAFGVAKFEVLGWLRDKGRDRIVLNDEVVEKLADESAQADEHLGRRREALEHCLGRLPSGERDVVMEAYGSKARIQDLAEREGRTVPGFYQWLYRVRRQLMSCIERRVERGRA